MQSKTERIQKIIARAGLASRREADEWVSQGLVTVNGKIAKLGDKADASKDAIKVNGKLLHAIEEPAYYLFNKPWGVICMVQQDRSGRDTLADFIDRIPERVFPIGRLGFTQEGLVILTNDGDFSEYMLKKADVTRTFHVKTSDLPEPAALDRLARPARMEGMHMVPTSVKVLKRYARNALIEWTAKGPSSMDVKLFFEHRSVRVEKVVLAAIDHLSILGIPRGRWTKLAAKDIAKWKAKA